jgi:hypothetical protein
MNQLEPQKVLRCLAEGLDPISLHPLSDESPLQKPYLIRVFYAAADALTKVQAREAKRSTLPKNAGRAWTALEDEELEQSFTAGTSLKLLAAEHLRTVAAIRARLIKLGKISEFDEVE